tara:strand:+ start:196 stop:732 length:537 start_codon:yes stop_codon:yes gene_type:complete
MRMKILSIAATLLLVAACASEEKEVATSSGSGASQKNSTSSNSSTSAASASSISAPAPGTAEEFITIGDRVYFDFDKAEIRADETSTLKDQAAWLKKYMNVTIVVEGHADERGTREYNLALGERRANAVKEYLVSRGVSASRIETVSYGKERPAVLGSNDSAWAQNRRGVSVVRGGGG